MFRKGNTKLLLITLVILSAVLVFTYLTDEKKGARTFREELVNMDTSLVNIILLFPQSDNHKEIKLVKNGNVWNVKKENFSTDADSNNIRNLLSTFALLKPLRLAATEKSKWKEYQVDDLLGTRIKFISAENILLDIVVGKFSYNNTTRSGISYVRIYDENKVYAVDGFIPMAVNQPFNQWRNKTIFAEKKENFTKLVFNYPSDSGFVLMKENNSWKLDNEFADSNKVEQYLNTISSLSSSSFVDNYTPGSSPVMSLTIRGNNMPAPVLIKAFSADSIQRYIIHSSFNSGAYFSANANDLDKQIFKKRNDFLSIIKVEEKTEGE